VQSAATSSEVRFSPAALDNLARGSASTAQLMEELVDELYPCAD
jgi:hypothetical protein